ncbi:three-helix bundle dimerization domain-containing protein [Rhodococcus indonesiensis]|uniref:three-helix bundle dimerization domain-containing protein n=1 Tax=Rhodococcus indonesiensis TaxID=3055869 RepID=UPI0039F6C0B0
MTDRTHPVARDPRPLPGEDEMLQIESVVARLVARFPTVPPLDIDLAVRTAEKRFADATIRAFVPLLIEKAVRRTLGDSSREPGTEPG